MAQKRNRASKSKPEVLASSVEEPEIYTFGCGYNCACTIGGPPPITCPTFCAICNHY